MSGELTLGVINDSPLYLPWEGACHLPQALQDPKRCSGLRVSETSRTKGLPEQSSGSPHRWESLRGARGLDGAHLCIQGHLWACP